MARKLVESDLSSAPSDTEPTPKRKGRQPPKPAAATTTKGRKRAAEVEESETKPASKRTRTASGSTSKKVESVAAPPEPPKSNGRGKRAAASKAAVIDQDSASESEAEEKSTKAKKAPAKKATKGRTTKKAKEESDEEAEPEVAEANGKAKGQKAKRKTKEEKEAEMQPLAARTVSTKVLVGAHVSASGGAHKSIANSVHIGGNAFALFLKSQRKWANPALAADHCTSFHSQCKEHGFTKTKSGHLPILPHGSYLVNLCHPDPDRTKQAYDSFLDDLDRCRQLGIGIYNFHPGNSAGSDDRQHAIKHLASNLNNAHKDKKSGDVITLLETMAAIGSNTVGSTFEDLAETIALVEDKDRVGVCLDTCHIFAAGYDIRTPETWSSMMDKFDKVIGLKYLKALHMNDSKAPLSSGRDLHANIGTGFIGLRGFWNVMNDQRIWGLPLILETPTDETLKDDKGKKVEDKNTWAKEIKLLENLVGMDVESDDFKKLEDELNKRGEAERKRIQDQVDKKGKKAEKGAAKGKKGKKQEDETEDEDSE